MYVESITLLTKEYNEYTVITPKVLDIVKRSEVQPRALRPMPRKQQDRQS